MKLVHYSPYLLREETGTSNSTFQWCEALSRAGTDVTVIVDENSLGREGPVGSRCITIPHRFGGRWHAPVNIGEALVSADLFIVHGGWTARNIVACRGASERGIPYLVTTHGVYNPRVLERGSLKKRVWNVVLERRHLSRAFAMHMFFPEETEGLRRLRVSTPTVVVPNGMSYRADALWDGGSGDYLLWLGRFDPEVKALDLLIESYLHLAEEERPLLRLHGRDWKGQKAKVAGLVRELGLETWIAVGDPVYGEDKWRLISAAAGCVYPSRWDASPMAVAEAVACGVPTLVADYPLGRLLAKEGAALMCDRSPDRIAEGIRHLRSEKGRELGRRGIEIARGVMSWDAVAASWLEQVSALMTGTADARRHNRRIDE